MNWFRWFPWRRRRDERILVVALNLWGQYDNQNAEIVEAFAHADLSWFTHVMIYVPSQLDFPDATDNAFVRDIVRETWAKGLRLIWCRGLWPSWPPTETMERDDWLYWRARDHVQEDWCVVALAGVACEARGLGADATAFDAEMYGASPLVRLIKRGVSRPVAAAMGEAVDAAARLFGKVDYIFPAAAHNPDGYQWITNGLGRYRCDQRTYYAHPPELVDLRAVPPDGERRLVHLWGCNVHATGAPANPKRPDVDLRLTPAEVQAIDMRAVRRRHQECRGIWVYADPTVLPDVMLGWGAEVGEHE